MSPDQLQSFLALAVGFAVAGMLASGYQVLTAEPASFRLMAQAPRAHALAAVPFLVFAAPFIIMRNTVRARRLAERRFVFVMAATMLAGFWSLMSGTVLIMALRLVGGALA